MPHVLIDWLFRTFPHLEILRSFHILLLPLYMTFYIPSILYIRSYKHLLSNLYRLTSNFPSFGVQFSPVKFSAQSHSTSELLRTLLMSGCF